MGGQKYLPLALNLALSIRRNAPQLERYLAFVALDREALHELRRHGFNAVLRQTHAKRKKTEKTFGASAVPQSTKAQRDDEIWKMRWLIQLTALNLGLNALVVDSDLV